MYDINNSSYYVDPASTSNMSRVQAADWFYASGNKGLYFSSWGGGFYMEDSTWVRVYNGKSFYQASGTLRCDGDIRAPIFYDQSDTAYYVNPASTSRLNAIDFGDSSPTLQQSGHYLRITGTNGYIDIGQGNTSYSHFYTDRGQYYFNVGLTVDGYGIRMYDTAADVRSYIFYDQGDTAYYVNPNGTSVLNNLTINGTVTGISAGASGGGSDEIFWENGQNVTSNYTITNGKNAMSAGPITVNSGVTVTVGDGETWTVV